jgi:SHS2 domain-containing protein
MMQRFRILEHTADIGFEAFGETREEVFANAARALFHIVIDLGTVELRESAKIMVAGEDPPSLLVNWLSELLFLQDAEGWLFREFAINSLSEKSLAAVARGEQLDPARHQLKLLVKAITYHQLILEQTAAGWRAQVYVDI